MAYRETAQHFEVNQSDEQENRCFYAVYNGHGERCCGLCSTLEIAKLTANVLVEQEKTPMTIKELVTCPTRLTWHEQQSMIQTIGRLYEFDTMWNRRAAHAVVDFFFYVKEAFSHDLYELLNDAVEYGVARDRHQDATQVKEILTRWIGTTNQKGDTP